jgi:hypothetical protein
MAEVDVITRIRPFTDSEDSLDRRLMDAILNAQEESPDRFRVINFELGYGPRREPAIRAFIEAGVNSGHFVSYVFYAKRATAKNVAMFLKSLGKMVSEFSSVSQESKQEPVAAAARSASATPS